ncbi:MAG TPA: glutathione S-transferase family protein, partial [Kofleriaceae bacterium]|nr:glutathione S-transferase family protein [Kofleriaceae bacterium]
MKLYYDPRSTYSQKALLALYEKGVAFTPMAINLSDPQARAELRQLNPLGKVPVLVVDDGWKVPEASILIEYLDTHVPGSARLIPEDADLARQTRFHDRLADLYVNDSVKKIFFDGQKPEGKRDPEGVAEARARLDMMFTGLDQHLASRTWIMGDTFTMADCALVPSLGYSRRLHPFDRWKNLTAYANRAFERPSFQKVAAELAPYLAKAS